MAKRKATAAETPDDQTGQPSLEVVEAPPETAEAPPPSDAYPPGFTGLDDAPRDGRTVRLWFGTSPDEMTDKYIVLGRWRQTREWNAKRHGWVVTGFWCHPHSNMKIGFDFRAFALAPQVSQQDIDASNAAVHQENLRRQERLRAKQTSTDEEQRATA